MIDRVVVPRPGSVPRFTSLEAGRAIGALLVLAFHTNITSSQAKYFSYETLEFFRGAMLGPVYFFVMSGFVMVIAHRKNLEEGSGTGRFLWKRFQRVYPTLWTVVVPLIVLMIAVPSLRWAGSFSVGDAVAALTIMPYPQENVLAVEWSLRYEVVFYLLLAMTIRWRRAALVLWSAWCAVGVVGFWYVPSGILGFFVSPIVLLFVAGMIVALVFQRIPLRAAIALLTIGGGIAVAWLVHAAIPAIALEKSTVDIFVYGVSSTLIVAGLASMEHHGKLSAPRFLCFLGAASYSIYLVHYPVVSVFMKVAVKLRAMGLPDYAGIALVLVAGLGAGVAHYLLLDKPLLNVVRRIGDRYMRRHAG